MWHGRATFCIYVPVHAYLTYKYSIVKTYIRVLYICVLHQKAIK